MLHDRPEKTVLIFSVPAGLGHSKPADALVSAGKLWFPAAQLLHRNILDFYPRPVSPLYSWLHTTLMHHPYLLRFIYSSLKKRYSSSSAKKSISLVNLFSSRRLVSCISSLAPAHIVCTHCLAAEIVSHLICQKKIAARLWVVSNDYTFYPWWVHDHVSGYCVPTDDVRQGLLDWNVPPEKIHVTGLPVMPDFLLSESGETCAVPFGLDSNRFICLLMAGSGGTGPVLSQVHALLSSRADFQLVVVAGLNSLLLKRLRHLRRQWPQTLFPIGYVTDISKLMACAGLVITKPGGSTVAECSAMGKPMLLVSPAPLLEEANAAWLVRRGAALLAPSVTSLSTLFPAVLKNPDALADMRAAASLCGYPYASRTVLEKILLSL